jgi:arylsulfatase A-like enzyme
VPGYYQSLSALLALLALSAGPLLAADKAPARLPNIVLIISDDHGPADYSFLGNAHIRTPRLDKLAAQSLVFPRGYVTSSLCCPSLASLLTGLYPHQNRITSNDPPRPAGKKGKDVAADEGFQAGRRKMNGYIEQVPTLARLLGRLGYLSFQSGKWWWASFRTGGFTHGMTHGVPQKGGRHGDEGLDIGRKTMAPVFDFIDTAQKEGKPFLVWYAPMLPHQPHNPPERFLNKYKGQTDSPSLARYWAMVEWFDETCGQLLDHLDQRGLAENTIVVYLADNGWIQNPRGEGSVRAKLTQYEAGHRTPIMIRWPGRVRPARSEQAVSSIDVAPTLLRAVGLQPTPAMQDVDLLDPAARAKRTAVFGECFTHDAVDLDRPAASLRYRWVVEGDWRLIVPDAQNVPNGQIELYNLAQDPGEERNLATLEADRVRALRQRLDAWWNPAAHTGPQSSAGN